MLRAERGDQPDRPEEPTEYVQLATRIPKPLLQRLRVHCVRRETTMMQFIAEAIEGDNPAT